MNVPRVPHVTRALSKTTSQLVKYYHHLNRSCDVAVILSKRRKLASSPAIRIKPALSLSERRAENLLLNERTAGDLQKKLGSTANNIPYAKTRLMPTGIAQLRVIYQMPNVNLQPPNVLLQLPEVDPKLPSRKKID